MNIREHMIIIKGEIKTPVIRSCQYNASTNKMEVEYSNGNTYLYAYENVEWLKEPQILNPNLYRISRAGHDFFDVEALYVFRGRQEVYWHICFGNGSERDYPQRELSITESCLTQSHSGNVFEYIKQIAALSELKNEETGHKILAGR